MSLADDGLAGIGGVVDVATGRFCIDHTGLCHQGLCHQESSMPIVTIQQFPRDLEQKRELARRVTEAFVEVYGAEPQSVQVFFSEVEAENWAKGGVMGSDSAGR
ncbi:4-oxalocrotonate tautomerase family protein [Halomonas campisalis]|uniref:4-oxalocrotonate tautomerase family protein n=2 Tax=Billgrantia campisalis TaxID=74661 RepID=A0ABS9P706_9GAMM|nr:4-oxalocrotonate tautomerase family protein [Halomonas campisalis]MCG6657571.1 4-oxalocrotonate tautomerase family protein [Halomonas campisalis]MDR5862655.1 4-oxalocrotonate tautomerase family protein [Halomonas campisalis]